MKGLYNEIELALDTLIEGLNYDFLDGSTLDDIDPEKMRTLASAKTGALLGAKKIIDKWIDSPNKPSNVKIKKYINEIVSAGDNSIDVLRKALKKKIDFEGVEAHKHTAALMAKPIIVEAIFDIDNSMKELRDKLESGDLTFKEKEFRLGYPELYAKGEFTKKVKYHTKRLTEEGAVILDPLCSEGEKIVVDDLEIILPEVPVNRKHILYHKEKKEDQYWRRMELPNITTSNVDDHHKFILKEFKRRREGVWFFNNGEPTYITGSHYFALQYCKMIDNGGYMDFRISQQRLFYFMDACIIDNRSLGMLFGKGRRRGFTYSAITQVLNRATTTKNTKHGLMSKSGTDAEEAFAKESYMFLNLPFWFRPIVKGKLDSPKELYFGQPSDNSKQTKQTRNISMDEYLNTSVDWRNTKNGSYDSIKLDTYILDEIFKIESPNNVIVHLSMVAPTMMPNGRVVGKMLAGSTMGLFKKGGEQGLELIMGSLLSTRDEKTKKTVTGLYFHFLPAHENMEEFTDKYGKCWVEKPHYPVVNVFGDPITEGALDYLLAIEAQKKKQSDMAYNEQIRTYPRSLDHLMRDDSKECVFNMEKIYEQLDHNKTLAQEEKYTVGNFEWEGVKDGKVEFRPRPDGRFKIAWMPSAADGTKKLQNRVREENGKFFPLNTDCVRFGCDPYSYAATSGAGSKGGLHGKTIFLPDGGAPSNIFVLEYLARPADDTIFFEDVIKCVKFYGAPILVESNRLDLSRHMYNRGYRGFCLDRLDKPKHKLNDNEKKYGGQMMAGRDILDSHMSSIGTWVQNYVGVYSDDEKKLRTLGDMGDMPFKETLQDWLRFDPANRTEHDATISSGLAIMACQKEKYKGKHVEKKKIDISTLLTRYSMKGDMGKKIG